MPKRSHSVVFILPLTPLAELGYWKELQTVNLDNMGGVSALDRYMAEVSEASCHDC